MKSTSTLLEIGWPPLLFFIPSLFSVAKNCYLEPDGISQRCQRLSKGRYLGRWGWSFQEIFDYAYAFVSSISRRLRENRVSLYCWGSSTIHAVVWRFTALCGCVASRWDGASTNMIHPVLYISVILGQKNRLFNLFPAFFPSVKKLLFETETEIETLAASQRNFADFCQAKYLGRWGWGFQEVFDCANTTSRHLVNNKRVASVLGARSTPSSREVWLPCVRCSFGGHETSVLLAVMILKRIQC